MLYQNILETIGNTPLIKIKNAENPNVNIYIKLEGQNPGGSVKDRIALNMIETAEKSGELTKEKIIFEPTSGNTGIGLAMVAAQKGYKIILTMSRGVTKERKKILKALGAKIILTNQEEGTDGAILKAKKIIEQNPHKYWMPNQFENPANPEIHYKKTAEEIIKDMPQITHFIAGLGTSGTIVGISKKLKEYNKDIQIIAIEPILGHKIQGLKNMKESIVPKIYDESAFDVKIQLEDKLIKQSVREIAKTEGLLLGMSSGAGLYAAKKISKKIKSGNIVIISPDRGEKYLSTDLYNIE